MSDTPERCKVSQARLITGLEKRTLQALASAGRIPGASKLGGVWTFDEPTLRRWARNGESKWRGTSTGAERRGGADFKPMEPSTAKAYERLFGAKRKTG